MRAVVTVFAIVALLATPTSLDAFLLPSAGPPAQPSLAAPAPPSPHLFPATRSDGGTRGAPPHVLIAEAFYYALRDDEYIVLVNPGEEPADIGGWRVTDREGTIEFPGNASLPAGARSVVTRNATSYWEDTLDVAEYAYEAGDAAAMVVVTSIPRLNNDGDEVLLLDPSGNVVDAFVYGGSSYSGAGWSGAPAAKVGQGKRAVRTSDGGGVLDTDTASDWDSLRSYGLGQSDRPFTRFDVAGSVVGFLSPDDSLPVLSGYLDSASASIHSSVYTLTNPGLAEALRAAASRGVDVRVLLEGGPVGGIDEREWSIAHGIRAAGGEVRFIADDFANDVMARFRFLHAKYAVIDGRVVLTGSENWGEHGFPAPGRLGNRGWQLAVESPEVAGYFETLFLEDFDPRRRDSRDVDGFLPNLVASNETPEEVTYRVPIGARRFEGQFTVTPVIGPEHSFREDGLLGLLGSARDSIDIEAFYIATMWGVAPNPYLEAAIDAARRGVAVRILLDGTWYNVEGDDPVDNDDTVAHVNRIARTEGLPLAAKVGDAEAKGFAKFHNKGVIVDGSRVFVSSLNWNRNAAMNNREVGVVLENPPVASLFREAFEQDWSEGGAPEGDRALEALSNPLALPFLTLVAVNVALLWAVLRRRGKGGKAFSEGGESE